MNEWTDSQQSEKIHENNYFSLPNGWMLLFCGFESIPTFTFVMKFSLEQKCRIELCGKGAARPSAALKITEKCGRHLGSVQWRTKAANGLRWLKPCEKNPWRPMVTFVCLIPLSSGERGIRIERNWQWSNLKNGMDSRREVRPWIEPITNVCFLSSTCSCWTSSAGADPSCQSYRHEAEMRIMRMITSTEVETNGSRELMGGLRSPGDAVWSPSRPPWVLLTASGPQLEVSTEFWMNVFVWLIQQN